MGITFLEKKKRQRILILALLGLLLLIAVVVWGGFFATSIPVRENVAVPARKIEVDTSILSHPILNELDDPAPAIEDIPEVGRDNPFLPAP